MDTVLGVKYKGGGVYAEQERIQQTDRERDVTTIRPTERFRRVVLTCMILPICIGLVCVDLWCLPLPCVGPSVAHPVRVTLSSLSSSRSGC